MGNLSENSKAYYDDNDYYEIFSQAEDFLRIIDKKLRKYARLQTVLDAGCGTGKYARIIKGISKKYLGVDKSEEQIKKAREKFGDEYFLVEDLANLKFDENSFDIVISCWCLGTMPEDKRIKVLENLKFITKNQIIFVENLPNCEFETIRGHDKDGKTKEYNSWLKENGFVLEESIDTYFMFGDCEIAKETFETIYNKEVAEKITSNIISHKVGIFVWRKNNDL